MFPQKNKIVGQEYKEEYKRKRESKHISKDPEIKKRFGVFQSHRTSKIRRQASTSKAYTNTTMIF